MTDKPESLSEMMDRILAEAMPQLEADVHAVLDAVVTEGPLLVQKAGGYMPVSCCVLTDATGENHCDHEPYVYPKPPIHRRVKWWVQSRWSSTRMRLGSWIAGTNLDERDDDW